MWILWILFCIYIERGVPNSEAFVHNYVVGRVTDILYILSMVDTVLIRGDL